MIFKNDKIIKATICQKFDNDTSPEIHQIGMISICEEIDKTMKEIDEKLKKLNGEINIDKIKMGIKMTVKKNKSEEEILSKSINFEKQMSAIHIKINLLNAYAKFWKNNTITTNNAIRKITVVITAHQI